VPSRDVIVPPRAPRPVLLGVVTFLLTVCSHLSAAAAQTPEGALAGRYTAGPLELSLDGAGTWEVRLNGATAVTGAFELRGDTLVLNDRGGPRACPPDVAGMYAWSIAADTLTLRPLSDACEGRRGAIGRAWRRRPGDVQALVGANVMDGTGAPVRPGMTVVVDGGTIRDVFPDGARPLPSDARRVEIDGLWLIPGLIDSHVHLATDPSRADDRATVLRRLRNALHGGVTTVRDMGGDARVLAGLAREALLGELDVPAIVYSAIFAGPEFFGDPRVVASSRGGKPGEVAWARVLDDDTDLVRAVAEAKGAGASAIKLYADVRPELIAPLVAEARRQGLAVWGHSALFPARPSEVVATGVDVVSHAGLLAWEPTGALPGYRQRAGADYDAVAPEGGAVDEVLRAMALRGTILDPTLFVYFANERAAAAQAWAARVTARAHELGVRVAAGTDGLIGPEEQAVPNLHEEMRLLVERAGLSPLDAIAAATSVSAAAVGLQDRGVIAPGKVADLVVLSADPTADIANTRAIHWVMKGGRRVGGGDR